MQTLGKIMTLFVTLAVALVAASTLAPSALAAQEAKELQTSATDRVFLQEAHADVLFEVLVDRLAKLKASKKVRDVANSLALKGTKFDKQHIRPTANAAGVRLGRPGENAISTLARLSPYQVILVNDLRKREGRAFDTAALNALLFVNNVWMGQAMAVIRMGRVAQVRGVAEVACGIAKSNIKELLKLIPPASRSSK
jgi:predicted outer membrane protein